jgi:peroxin-4
MNLATTRLNKELREYMKIKENAEIQLFLKDNLNIYKWQAKLKGPPDTPYSEGVFYIDIVVPEDYPISPPKCKFITKVFHPNIHFDTGEICFELLKDKWMPAWTLESVCRAILDLLSNPNADSPLNCDSGNI